MLIAQAHILHLDGLYLYEHLNKEWAIPILPEILPHPRFPQFVALMMHLVKSYFPNCPLVILGTEQHLLKTRDGVQVQTLHEQVHNRIVCGFVGHKLGRSLACPLILWRPIHLGRPSVQDVCSKREVEMPSQTRHWPSPSTSNP